MTEKTVIGFVCERSVELNDSLEANGQLKENRNVKIIKVPCSGFVKPTWIEKALKNGASGAFVCGCRMGDCHYREGNKMIDDRLCGTRPPYLKKTVDKKKVRTFFYAIPEKQELLKDIQQFVEEL